MSRKRKFFKIKPKDKRVQFILKTPRHGKGRASFSIVKRTISTGAKPQNETLQLDQLNGVNERFKKKDLPFESALIHAKQIVSGLYEHYWSTLPAVIHNEGNLKILDEYWEKEFADKDLVEPASSYNRLVRAVEAVGHLSLISASKEELQKEIDPKFKGNRQRSIISALNQILKYLGRNLRLRKVREEVREVRYLNEKEFETFISHIEDPKLKLIYIAAFSAGLRVGEVFAVRPTDIHNGVLNVATQIDRSRTRRITKNRKVRKTLILDRWLKDVRTWAEIPLNEKMPYRNLPFSKITKRICKKLFPKDPMKHCVIHDCRHSYAIYLVSKGVSLSQVAQALGDSVAVAEKHYSGFILTPESIDLMKAVLRRK